MKVVTRKICSLSVCMIVMCTLVVTNFLQIQLMKQRVISIGPYNFYNSNFYAESAVHVDGYSLYAHDGDCYPITVRTKYDYAGSSLQMCLNACSVDEKCYYVNYYSHIKWCFACPFDGWNLHFGSEGGVIYQKNRRDMEVVQEESMKKMQFPIIIIADKDTDRYHQLQQHFPSYLYNGQRQKFQTSQKIRMYVI
eukprot:UN33240